MPESFRGGCSFGAGRQGPVSPAVVPDRSGRTAGCKPLASCPGTLTGSALVRSARAGMGSHAAEGRPRAFAELLKGFFEELFRPGAQCARLFDQFIRRDGAPARGVV